jgi:hypothetical protein
MLKGNPRNIIAERYSPAAVIGLVAIAKQLWQVRARQDPSFHRYMALDLAHVGKLELLAGFENSAKDGGSSGSRYRLLVKLPRGVPGSEADLFLILDSLSLAARAPHSQIG